MNVAVFTDNDFDKVNGVTTTLTALVREAPSDLRIRVYTAADLPSDAPDYLAFQSRGLPIPFYPEMKIYLPRWQAYLQRVLQDKIDVLHVTTPGPVGLTALWIAQRVGLPLIGSFHTDLAAYTRLLSGSRHLGRLMGKYLRWFYGRCGLVFVPSEATRLQVAREKATSAARLEVWTRGVDSDAFTPDRRSARLRDAWRLDDTRLGVLYAGRVSREKGLDLLPAITDGLHARRIDHRLIVAGDGPMRRELAARCPDAVFTGTLGRERLTEVYASADVFVFPSRTDTAGNVVLEAQASGLPVIVSDQGGPRENLRPGESGLVCDGTDAAAWTSAVGRVLRDRELRAQMSDAARRYALGRRWELALAPLFAAYRELGGLPRRTSRRMRDAA